MVIYYKEFFAVCPVDVESLNECAIFEVSIKNKRRCVISLYRSSSQTQDEFDFLLINFEKLIGDIIAKNPLFVLDSMLDQQIRGKIIFLRLKVLRAILLLHPMV